MSLKKGSLRTSTTPANPGRQTPGGGTPSASAREDPLDRMFAPSEDADWEETFLSVIRPASSSTPSNSERDEVDDPSENKDQEQDQKTNEVKNSNGLNVSNSQPIELLNENSQVVEVDVPVMEGVPSGSFKPLWSQEFISCTSPTNYRCVPLYKVEGREDPKKNEGFNEPESPFKPNHMLSGRDGSPANRDERQNDSNTSQEKQRDSPHPETFFDNCPILQWVINDSDNSDLNPPSTPGSSEDEYRPTATTTNFIKELKRDVPSPSAEESFNQPPNSHSAADANSNLTADPETLRNAAKELHQSVVKALKSSSSSPATSFMSQMLGIEAVAGPSHISHANTRPAVNQQSRLPVGLDSEIKSEPDPEWKYERQNPRVSRKRGRPALPSASRSITPHPSANATADLTENEASAQKFRRMRDLNNEASRRCRENRKLKQQDAERELLELMVINKEKKRIVAEMEKEVQEMKKKILKVAAGGELLQQRLHPGQQNCSSTPPDASMTWSNM